MYMSLRKEIRQLDRDSRQLATDQAQHRILDFYTKITPRLANAESCSIFIAEPDGNGNWIRSGTGLEEEPLSADTVSPMLVSKAMAKGGAIYLDKLDEVDNAQDIIDAAPGVTPKDVLCIPLHSTFDNSSAGAIQILNRQNSEPYDREELSLLEELANLLEVSLENVYLFDEARSVVGRTWQMLTRITVGSVLVFIALLLAFTFYWFGFWLAGGL